MFDSYAQDLIDLIPRLDGLEQKTCKRYLSKAFYLVLQSRYRSAEHPVKNNNINITTADFEDSDEETDWFDGLADEAPNEIELKEIRDFLRRLSDALESISVFDRLNGVEVEDEVQTACAFVAAEALVLHSELTKRIEEENDPFLRGENFVAIESALLYMIGGYDINALSVVRDVNTTFQHVDDIFEELKLASANNLVKSILSLCNGDIITNKDTEEEQITTEGMRSSSYEDLVNEIRIKFYTQMELAVKQFMEWLGGYPEASVDEAIDILERVSKAALSGKQYRYTEFSDIYHMSCLLIAAIKATRNRSVIHVVPLPEEKDEEFISRFKNYLNYRARGEGGIRGRPFLWPTAIQYIKNCLPGPNNDCVIAMPTGSGKSFVAELATVHALARGWVLYLAPTNALAHQIRRDLAYALKPFKDIQVRAFVGGDEYSSLETVEIDEKFYVAVMTPEKCALALRLRPEQFSNCSLCVFDECHLINDGKRGLTADVLLAQLFGASDNIRFLLMSAMVSNPQELADWLAGAHDGRAIAEPIKWRPSRTLRGLLVLNKDEFKSSFQSAKESADRLPKNRKNVNFDTPLAAIFGLSGPWTLDGSSDYLTANLPATIQARASKESQYPFVDSWKNTSSRIVAELFADSGMPVINFLLSSRHHAFSSANKVTQVIAGSSNRREALPEVVTAWLSLADAELGVETVLWDLLVKGVAVHTSAMLQVEQAAAEWMFTRQKAKLMFATGTLAQGLNLPSVAVVISGTSLGDSREDVDTIDGLTKVNAMILNGFGRAGRPGFSNQGVALLVSDNPYLAPVETDVFPQSALSQYGVLGEPDASVEVHSPVETFIDNIMLGNLTPEMATSFELELTSLLAEIDNDQNNRQVLSRTFGAYKRRNVLTQERLEEVRNRIVQIKDEFFERPDVPEWMNTVAMKAGADFFSCLSLWEAYKQRGIVDPKAVKEFSVLDWLDVFFDVMVHMPPWRIQHYLPNETIKTPTVLTRIRDEISKVRYEDGSSWERPDEWISLWGELKELLKAYMTGRSFSEIAQKYLSLDVTLINNGRSSGSSPIPAVFKLIRTVFEPLAVDAGCFLALNQYGVFESEGGSPVQLNLLPMCIRYGCESIGTISWFRFGIRQRTCAHALQKLFPLPEQLANDNERANWVRKMRRSWLEQEETSGSVLDHARTIIFNDTNF